MDYPFQIYVCDTETTGLNYLSNEILEISMYHVNQDRQKTWHLQCLKPETVQPDALRINGIKLEDATHKTAEGKDKFKHPKDVIVDIENWMMEDMSASTDRILVGHNIGFDSNFITKLWNDNGAEDTYPFGNRPYLLDTRQIELFINLVEGIKNEYSNLGSLVEKYGIKKEKAHRSDADTRMTKDVLLKQLSVFK
jgi:ATP-dependent DNA helicase DinG